MRFFRINSSFRFDRYLGCVLMLCICLYCQSIGLCQDITFFNDQFTKLINKLVKDINCVIKATSQNNYKSEEVDIALNNQNITLNEISNFIAKIDTKEKLEYALFVLRGFSYRINSLAEKKAIFLVSSKLEQQIKYFSQTENQDCNTILQQIYLLQKDIENKDVFTEYYYGARSKHFADTIRRSATSKRLDDQLLGAHVINGKTYFSVYSPAATEVNVIIFNNPTDTSGTGYSMKKDNLGIWRCVISQDLTGKWYGYTANGPQKDGYIFDPKRLLNDPYAFANFNHDGKSLIIKRDFKWDDHGFKPPKPHELIIYEVHLKDFSAHPSSGVEEKLRGKYLGFLKSKGLKVIKELGVNAIELLPIHEFDNFFAGHPNYWGYMTSHYFAPECSYATGKNGEAVVEFKKLVNELHKEGFAVIMDVVFNHTAEGNEKGIPLNFKGLDNPGYYRLTDDKKYYWNGSGCGNEFKSESPMSRKLIIDSLKYWVNEYHIDGFRFDLATIIDKETMLEIAKELPDHVILIAEPWAADWKRNQWGKSDLRNTRWAKWNDDFRENVRAFMRGEFDRNNLMTVIAGTCFWWAAKPTESVNYIECHDGATISDLFAGNIQSLKLGAVVLLTSQGIPMIHAGQEFNKNKKGNDNSYDQDNEINWIDWSLRDKYSDLFEFYKNLIALRKKYSNFKHTTALTNQHIDWYLPPNPKGLGYRLKGETDIIVLLNADGKDWIRFTLPDNNPWKIVCNGHIVNLEGRLGEAIGDYNVPPRTAVILKNK